MVKQWADSYNVHRTFASFRLGSAAADLVNQGVFGVMVAARGEATEAVPLEQVAGKHKPVPPDHSWVQAARHVGTCLGD